MITLDWTRGELRKGLDCFDSGAFFEAHECWELVCLAAREPEKTFLQALIRVAASFHHFQCGNHAGTLSLLRSVSRRLEQYPESFGGVAITPLRISIGQWRERLETLPQSPQPPIPRLELNGNTYKCY